jgi:streptogramin lyase
MRKELAVLAIVVAVILAATSFEVYQTYFTAPSGCLSIPSGTIVRSQTTITTFGPMTEYDIPGMDRYPAALTVAPDGSVWFVEWEVPGVAHLYPNNYTLVEYAWKGYPKPNQVDFCSPSVASSGIALWQGRVWAADQYGSAIVGVNPSTGSTVLLNTTSKVQPYWLAVGPDGDLWFTSDNYSPPQYIGRVFPNMTMSLMRLSSMGDDIPLQFEFVNSTLAFVAAINESGNKTVSCFCDGHIYSFNPSEVSANITTTRVGGDFKLTLPTSVSFSQGRIWVAQHYASSVVSYDLATGTWTTYPTSRVTYTNVTLPLEMDANGSMVWFDEHYANKMAMIDPVAGTLTEISASNPPVSTAEGIQNDEFIALSGGRLWYTSLSGNYVGFLNESYRPNFQLAFQGTNAASIRPGTNASFSLQVSGTWSVPMNVSVSDSESYSGIPSLIHITPSVSAIPMGASSFSLSLDIAVAQSIVAGNYTVAVTATNGDVQQTAYLFLTIG